MELGEGYKKDDIKIHEEVTKAIVGKACLEVPGVTALSGGNIYQTLIKWGTQAETKGVIVEKNEDNNFERVEVHVTVESGQPIPSVASNLQMKIKETVEAMTGKEVGEIYIYVDELRDRIPAAPIPKIEQPPADQ